MSEEIKNMLIEYIKKEYLDEDNDQEITAETKLISGGIVDSFSMVSLKLFLEKKFQIKIPDEKASPEAFDSVNNILTMLKEFSNV